MDWSENLPATESPRKELQGPRPTPLRINRESHKIKKPPAPPQPSQPSQAPPRQPVIIYQVSPKIIHTTPGDFMSLVQRLTGSSSSSFSDAASFSKAEHGAGGTISPAARFAAIEKAARPSSSLPPARDWGQTPNDAARGIAAEVEMGRGATEIQAGMNRGSILSPGPSSLSPIPSNFFSPPSSDPSSFIFLHDFSPAIQANLQNFLDVNFTPRPSHFVSPHPLHSPTPSFDLFNNFMDYP